MAEQVVPVVLAVQSSVVENDARKHVNIPEYTEHFRVCTVLGNKGETNAG